MNGIGKDSARMRWLIGSFRINREEASANNSPRTLPLQRCVDGLSVEAADRDSQTRHRLFARYRRRLVAADRGNESHQFGAQRLLVTNREVPHGVSAVRLEPVAFGNL